MNPEEKIATIFKRKGIDLCLTLPCVHLKQLILRLQGEFRTINLTREEEGVGIAAGATLAGRRPVMVIQSGGIGNSINALLSLTKLYSMPLPILVSWRGIYKEKLVGQLPMGRRMLAILEGAGIPYIEVLSAGELAKVEEGISKAFNEMMPYVILLSPHVFEGSDSQLNEVYPPRSRTTTFEISQVFPEPRMTRADAIVSLRESLANKLVVSNIGFPSRELYYISNKPNNFYMVGSLGMASSIGLGLSIFTDKEVVVLDGDGSILMNPNCLISAGVYGPSNLTILAVDNGAHGSTGNEKTAAYSSIDLEALAKASGITETFKTADVEQIKGMLGQRGNSTKFLHLIVKPGNRKVGTIPLTPVQIKKQFMDAVKE